MKPWDEDWFMVLSDKNKLEYLEQRDRGLYLPLLDAQEVTTARITARDWFRDAVSAYHSIKGVKTGQKSFSRYKGQIKTRKQQEQLLLAISNYKTFLSWEENSWRHPKSTLESFLGTERSGFFWKDFLVLPERRLSGPRSTTDHNINSMEEALALVRNKP